VRRPQNFKPSAPRVADSYQISFAQIMQNICWHLCKALPNKYLRGLGLISTFYIFVIAVCPASVSFNPVFAVLTMAAE